MKEVVRRPVFQGIYDELYFNAAEKKKMEFREDVQKLIEYKNFKEFTPIQQEVMPLIAKGRDVVGISATGTGKSHAFILPILNMIDTEKDSVQAIIAAPTRELANQLYKMTAEINMFNPDIRVKLIASGKDKERMIESLSRQPHIVVGTIGRLKDLFVDEAVLRLDQANIIALDEADMTLELGFLDDVDAICGRLPKKLQMLVFSATVPAQLQSFLRKYMHYPVVVEPKLKGNQAPQIRHILVNCRYATYQEKLLKILPGITPYCCMIFCKSKQDVISTYNLMKDNGYENVVTMHSDLSSRERKQNLRMISNNEARYIVCSDIMARGIDIESVSHVISLGLPSTLDYYTHRSGRTGRAGRSGISYLLFTSGDIPALRQLRNTFDFEYQDYRKGEWVEVRPFDYKPKKEISEEDKEIARIAKAPVKKVKPGYKKKRQQEIDSIRRRQRRLMIKKSIKEQQKERAKQAQREKNGY